jgi:hypothetical protein
MDNFINQLIISLFHTTLATFLNLCDTAKMTYIVVGEEYKLEEIHICNFCSAYHKISEIRRELSRVSWGLKQMFVLLYALTNFVVSHTSKFASTFRHFKAP